MGRWTDSEEQTTDNRQLTTNRRPQTKREKKRLFKLGTWRMNP